MITWQVCYAGSHYDEVNFNIESSPVSKTVRGTVEMYLPEKGMLFDL